MDDNNPLPTPAVPDPVASTPETGEAGSAAVSGGAMASLPEVPAALPHGSDLQSLGQVVTASAPEAAVSPPTSGRVTVAPSSSYRPQLSHQQAVAQRARFIAVAAASVLVMVVVVAVAWFLHASGVKKAASVLSTTKYAVTSVPLGDLSKSGALSLDQASQLTINGQLRINNSFVLTPTSTPTNPLLGQFYLNSQNNLLYYFNGSQFVSLVTGDTFNSLGSVSKTTPGSGLAINGTSLNNTGVLSLQGQAGAVTLVSGGGVSINGLTITNTGVTGITGTPNQITASAATGNLTLSLPQDIATGSAPSFASITVPTLTARPGDTGLVIGNTTQNLALQGATTTLSDTNGSFTSQIVFQNPTSNHALIVPDIGGTICTTANNCASVRSYVSLQPTSPGTADVGNLNITGAGIFGGQLNVSGGIVTTNTNINAGSGTITGNGSGLTNLNGSNITTGTVADARLSGNVALLNGSQTFTGSNIFNGSGAALAVQNASGYNVLSANTTNDTVTLGNVTNVAGHGLSGQLLLADGTSDNFAALLNTDTLTANRVISIPDSSGYLCLSNGNCNDAGGPGANSSLTNLANVALNVDLLPASDGFTNLGTSIKGFGNLYVADASNTYTYDLTGATTTADKTITIPSFSGGTTTLCLDTGNCAGAGTGVTTTGGTIDTVPLYSGSQQIGNSIISQDVGATTATVNGALSVTGTIGGDGSGLTSLNGSNVSSGTVANNRLVGSGALTVTAGTGLSGGGSVALGGSTSFNVVYGGTAGTAVQGNATLTCSTVSGTNLTGGGGTITLGNGGNCNSIGLTGSPTFSGNLTVQGSSGITVGSTATTGVINFLDGTNDGFGASLGLSGVLGVNQAFTLPSSGGTLCTTTTCIAASGTAGGDLQGTYPNPTIAKLQGKTLTVSATPTTGAVLQYNGSAFVDGLVANANLQGGSFTNITGVGALTTGSIGGSFGNINIGANTITSGTINGQTISSAANFTGTVAIQGANALTLGTTGTSTGAILFQGATGASGTLTLQGPANPSTNTLTLPNETGTLCSTGSICSGYAASTGGNYIAKNTNDTSGANYVGDLLGFTNTNTGAAGVLDLNNSGTNSGLYITQNGTSEPAANRALIRANNLTTTPSGNLLDLATNSVSQFHVDYAGNVTALGTYNTNTFNASTLTFGAASAATIQSASGQALNLTGNAASTLSTTAGNLTIQGGSGMVSLGSSTTLTANGALTVSSGGSGQLTLTSASGTIGTGSAISSTNTITGTTVNGTIGINTGSGTGTQRIDTSGNLVNIGNITGTGAITVAATGASNGVTVKNGTNSTSAFQIQNSNGNSLLTADTSNMQLNVGNLQSTGTISVAGPDGGSVLIGAVANSGTGANAMTFSGNEITDATRATATQGDGRQPPDSSTGIWEGTTNLMTNGGFESNTTGWAASGVGGVTLARDTTAAKFGSSSLSVTEPGLSSFEGAQYTGTLTNSTTYTWSVWVKAPAGQAMRIYVLDSLSTTLNTTLFTGTGAWQRESVTFTTDSTSTTMRVSYSSSLHVFSFNIDGSQLEQKTYATPYVNTNGASATRNAARVQAPVADTNITQGWYATRVRMGAASTVGQDFYLAQPSIDSNDRLALHANGSTWTIGNINAGTVDSSATTTLAYTPGTIVTAVFAWTASNLSVSINGGAFTTVSRVSVPSGSVSNFDIGSNLGSNQLDGDVLWSAAGTGTLTNTDAASLNALGNSDPSITGLNAIDSSSTPTFAWSGEGTAYSGTSNAATLNSGITLDDASLYRGAANTLETNSYMLLQNTSNSTSAFQIQNAAGGTLLNADTTNNKLTVGQGNLVVTGLGIPGTPSISAGSNQGGSLSGSAGTTYYYKMTALNGVGETMASSEASINGASFTSIAAPAAPTVAVNATAGNLNGTYLYKVTFVTANGETNGGTTSASVSPANQQVNLTAIPTGPTGTTARKIYRTVAGGADGTQQFVATIADNTTTTYTDNTADGSLGATVPGADTATTNTNNATITFTPITGATSYRIYRGTSSGGESAYQTTTTSPFTDTGVAGTNVSSLPTSDATARIGIGTSAPTASLQVVGTALFQTPVNTSTAFQVLDANGTSVATVNTATDTLTVDNLAVTGTCTGCGTSGTVSLQSAYTTGSTITTSGSNNITFNLNSSTSNFVLQNATTNVLQVSGSNGAITAQNSTNSSAAFAIQNAGGSNSTDTLLNLSTVPNVSNLVANASFEQNTTGWAAEGNMAISRVTGVGAPFGSAAMQVTNSGTPAAFNGAEYPVALTSGVAYEMSFYAKTTSAFSTVSFGYSPTGGTPTSGTSCATTGLASTTDWIRFTCSFTPTGTNGSSYVYIGQDDTTARTWYVDGVSLVQSSGSGTYYSEGALSLNGLALGNVLVQPTANTNTALVVASATGANGLTVNTDGSILSTNFAATLGSTLTVSGGTTINSTELINTNSATALTVRNAVTDANLIKADTLTTNNSDTNGGFETSSSTATGYATNHAGVALTVDTTAGNAYEGANTGKLVVSSSAVANSGIEYNLTTATMASSTAYTLSFYAKQVAGQSAFTTLTAGTAQNGSTETACTLNSTTVTAYWQRYTCTFTTGTTSGTPYFYIGQTDAGVAHSYYLDDIQFTAAGSAISNYHEGNIQLNGVITSPATFQNNSDGQGAFQIQNAEGNNVLSIDTNTGNLVTNSGFENGSAGWTAKGTSIVSTDSTAGNVYQGDQALKSTVTAATSGVTTSTFTTTISASTQYQLTFFAKCDSTYNTLTYGRQDVSGTDVNFTTSGTCTTNWQQYTAHWTTGGTITSPNIYVDLGSTTAGSIWVDDVSLIQTSISAATNYNVGNISLSGVITSPTIFQNTSNSTTALQIQNAAGTSIFDVDSQNQRVGIGTNAPGNLLSIGALTTASASSQLAVSIPGTSNSGIVIQESQAQGTLTAGFFLQAQSSNGTNLASIDYQGNLIVKAATINGDLTLGGHLITGNKGGATTTATASASILANGGSCNVSGDDTSGQITLNDGTTGWTIGVQCTINFTNSGYSSAPHPVITNATNVSPAAVGVYVNSTTTTFTLNFINADTSQNTYIWNYFNAQ